MARRSKAREVALQMLFQVDMNADVDGRMVGGMVREALDDDELRDFAMQLFCGVMECRNELDERIQQIATNWRLSRMAATDRNVLRLGAFEMLHTDAPRRVAIDEALELAKKFGSEQSAQFVNGILDQIPGRENEASSQESAND
ncbi:MAG: transcription antitermination factor NusB [Planctomycetaceae bacterium]|nr:transcription antitermination factor NusB [Planctomycetaceae bacterium]